MFAKRNAGKGNIVRSIDITSEKDYTYTYDNEESVCGIVYNDKPYYFLKNLQGDVIAIVDKNADTVARYSYDAWGICTVVQDSTECGIANINPYRYRGYYFDKETNLYYLQSRYYNPTVGRFVNGDESEFLSVNKSVLSKNIFIYCSNSPIDNVDYLGYLSMSTLAFLLDFGLFAVSFTPWGLACKIAIISFYIVRIGVAIVLLKKQSKKSRKNSSSWSMAVFDAAYNILVSLMGIIATLLSLPRINLSLKVVGIAIYRICQVFGIGLSGTGLIMTWANEAVKKNKRKFNFKR